MYLRFSGMSFYLLFQNYLPSPSAAKPWRTVEAHHYFQISSSQSFFQPGKQMTVTGGQVGTVR